MNKLSEDEFRIDVTVEIVPMNPKFRVVSGPDKALLDDD